MKNIIFLDVDGVLNIMSDSYYTMAWVNYGSDAVDYHLMRRLEYLIEKVPNSYIIISSSWSEGQLKSSLERRRFKYLDRILGRTSRDKKFRGEQINDWLIENDWESYIVLEDEIIDVCGEKCNLIPREFVIEVDMNEGLSNKNIERAINILNCSYLSEMDFY